LAYYGYRYYDPVSGRWPSCDPGLENNSLNLYAMIRNRLIGKFDVLGLWEGSGGGPCGPPTFTDNPGWSGPAPWDQFSLSDIGYVNDPYGSCVVHGFYRHCVNNCIMAKYGVPDSIIDSVARYVGNDQAGNPRCDPEDLNANELGREIGNQSTTKSCAESCSDAYDDAVNSQCCPGDKSIPKSMCSC
jgi:hypothetical protein